jgi:hypothetical protein
MLFLEFLKGHIFSKVLPKTSRFSKNCPVRKVGGAHSMEDTQFPAGTGGYLREETRYYLPPRYRHKRKGDFIYQKKHYAS